MHLHRGPERCLSYSSRARAAPAACRAAGAVSLRSTPPFTSFAFAHLRSGPPSYDAEGGTGSGHPATFALTGSISEPNMKSVSSLGQKRETTNTQTSVGKQNGLVLFTEIFLNYRPSGIWGSYVDSPPLETTHHPHWDLFSRTVVILNRGPSTLGPIFPEGHPFQPGTVHAGGRFPGRSPFKTGDRPRWDLFSRTVNACSGAGRYKATCHPRLGGACEGAATCRKGRRGSPVPPARDVKKAGSATPRRPPQDVKKAGSATLTRPPRDAGKTGTSADQRQERGEIVAGVVTRNRYVSGGGGCCRRRRRS